MVWILPARKKNAEQGRKQHRLGHDEPGHAEAERAVFPNAIRPLLALVDDVSEPAEENVKNRHPANPDEPSAGGKAVDAQAEADREQHQREGKQRRIGARPGDEIATRHGDVCGHGTLPNIK
jgi:hypothetical protein